MCGIIRHEVVIKAIRCKLQTQPSDAAALDATLAAFAGACNDVLAIAMESGKRRAFDLQKLCYRDIKERYGLTANYAVRACARVAASFGKGKRPPVSYTPTSADLDKDLIRFNEYREEVSIATVAGRLKLRLLIGNYQRSLLAGQKPAAGVLSKVDGKFYVNLCIETPSPEPRGTTPLGIDLGINRIATDSDGKITSGRKAARRRSRYARTKASLQARGTKGAKRVLKRLSGREARYQRDANHCLTKAIVTKAVEEDRYICVEDLTGIRQRTNRKGKRMRRMMGRWAFFQFRTFLAYKAAEAGVRVVPVDPAYTSKTCPECGLIGSRRKHRFVCNSCGCIEDADVVGARNIALRGAQVSCPVKSPGVRSRVASCRL